MYLTSLILPLLSSILSSTRLTGGFIGGRLAVFIKCVALLLTFHLFYEVVFLQGVVSLQVTNWKPFGFEEIQLSFLFDPLSVSKKTLVMFITTLVKMYSLDYKGEDPHLGRFKSYLGLFSFSKLLLLLADNLIVLFLGWEKVGVVSYLLVNFWFTRLKANQSALKALFKNKIGDAALVIGAVILTMKIGDVQYSTAFSLGYLFNENFLTWALLAFIIAGGAKSALIGLHSWLPSAKEGPTPVSALLHSATKVTAGVFLVIRLSPLIEALPFISHLLLVLGSLTAILGASSALVSQDLKRVVAFSTSSQLGYKIVCCGVSLYNLGLYHLLNHGFFKSLLFLASGAVLHAVNDNQDIRKKGGLVLHLPITYTAFFLASLSLVAFPFFTGFYSKDFLLTLLAIPYSTTATAAYILTLSAALFTSLYSIRIMKITFLSSPHYAPSFMQTGAPFVLPSTITDSPILTSLPLIILATLAVSFGYKAQYLYLDYGTDFYLNSIYINPAHNILLNGSLSVYSILKLLPLGLLILFILLIIKSPTFVTVPVLSKLTLLQKNFTSVLLSNKIATSPVRPFYFLAAFNFYDVFIHYFITTYYKISKFTYRYLDKGLLECVGPFGLSSFTHYLAFFLELGSTSFIIHYFYFIVIFFTFFSLASFYSLFIGTLFIYFILSES